MGRGGTSFIIIVGDHKDTLRRKEKGSLADVAAIELNTGVIVETATECCCFGQSYVQPSRAT